MKKQFLSLFPAYAALSLIHIYFQTQKALLTVPYTRTSHKQFEYKTIELEMDRPMKVIDQRCV